MGEERGRERDARMGEAERKEARGGGAWPPTAPALPGPGRQSEGAATQAGSRGGSLALWESWGTPPSAPSKGVLFSPTPLPVRSPKSALISVFPVP